MYIMYIYIYIINFTISRSIPLFLKSRRAPPPFLSPSLGGCTSRERVLNCCRLGQHRRRNRITIYWVDLMGFYGI